jgi:hypothetical protein
MKMKYIPAHLSNGTPISEGIKATRNTKSIQLSPT